MSQANEETAKYKLTNNHYNCNRYGQMRKTKCNQQVMPLYENCILNNKNNHTDQILLERTPTKSDTFNYKDSFVSDTTKSQVPSETSVSPDYEYVNIKIDDHENIDKKILLQKYFRSALVGPRFNIYENLCRGCNYGVFNARGPLCTFCECIVNGVSALRNEASVDSLTTSNNIYENICEHCGVIYSGRDCEECKCRRIIEQVKSEQGFTKNENKLNLGSAERLIDKSEGRKKKIKIKKSKSFNKSNKPKIFTNLWDTLRKPRTNATINVTINKKPLEIIHNVGGYEQVFHTKDTFDLKRICELKRNGTSCSDQHIYGRLKQNEITPERFNSTQSLTHSNNSLGYTPAKKRRISKAKFLRAPSTASSENSEIKPETNTATIYINNSVIQWMTSLRHEIHAYNTFNTQDEDALCYPKSIPSKNVLISCATPVTNRSENLQNLIEKQFTDCADLAEILHNSVIIRDFWQVKETEKDQQQPDCYQLMVEEFMANVRNRQMLKTKAKKQCVDDVKNAMTGVSNYDNYNIDNANDIPLRQATVTLAAMTTYNQNNNNNKHKRQGMYLRLEDHQLLQQHPGPEQMHLHNCKSNNYNRKHIEQNEEAEKENNSDCEHTKSLLDTTATPHNTVAIPDTLDLEIITCCLETLEPLEPVESVFILTKTNKRQGIHERNVLAAFEALLEQERTIQTKLINENDLIEPINKQDLPVPAFISKENFAENSLVLKSLEDDIDNATTKFPIQILDLEKLINQQQLSVALNTTIIHYDRQLKVFLNAIYYRNSSIRTMVYKISNKQLVRKFKKFCNYCEQHTNRNVKPKTISRELACVSSKSKLELNVTNGYNHAQVRQTNNSESLSAPNDSNVKNNADLKSKEYQKDKTPPKVPRRDPKTKLSPTSEIKRFNSSKMTKPGNNLKTETKSESYNEEESIYQPIWKFETKGKVLERYRTDDDYYDLRALKEKIQQASPNSEIPKILISNETIAEEETDHNNWETDEEFVFTKQMQKQRSSSLTSERMSTIRSTHSSNSSIGTSSSLSGSTITEYASSTVTLASTFSYSLRHYLFRNIGIFYSLTEPKLRAIIYDYDRIHSSKYFAKPSTHSMTVNDSGIGKSLSPLQSKKSTSISSTPSTSTTSSPVNVTKRLNSGKCAKSSVIVVSESDKCGGAKAKVSCPSSSTASQLIPSSVHAWKLQLLDINCMEDEEDMIVSECEILRAQQIKEDIDHSPSTQPQQFMQRFKSRSTENFLDLPIEDDKKTIAERLANMYTRFSPIQRGILNINGRNSPKSEKKAYKLNRASQTTSLYLEDGIKPKYPIFGAPLDQLELQQNVPRFVVDAVDYIERKDRIVQDGIYRACGNKFSIDELKQKLTKSYIYDTKLITADDIHTVTSLLKQFFRDLPEPVVPQNIYASITANLADRQEIDTIRIAIEEMREPNKSTLRFLIKHLTNVAACSSSNRMNASNVAIVWGPSLFAQNDTYDMIGRMNTLTKVLIENYDRIFDTNERLL